jgi:hypothetical protein
LERHARDQGTGPAGSVESQSAAGGQCESKAGPGKARAPAADPAAMREQLAAAYEKAIQLGPQAHIAAQDAVTHLEERKWSDALSRQEEALRLLKEIADSLPKPPPQENQKTDQNQEKKDDQKQDSQPSQQQDQKDPSESKDEKQKDQKQKDEKEKDEKQKQDSNDKQKSPSKATPQKSEAILRQVRQREKEYKERQKELQELILGGVPVDKDW